MESHENAMEVRKLQKAFGVLKAVDGIDFDWEDGEKELQKSIIFQFTNSNLRHQGQG